VIVVLKSTGDVSVLHANDGSKLPSTNVEGGNQIRALSIT